MPARRFCGRGKDHQTNHKRAGSSQSTERFRNGSHPIRKICRLHGKHGGDATTRQRLRQCSAGQWVRLPRPSLQRCMRSGRAERPRTGMRAPAYELRERRPGLLMSTSAALALFECPAIATFDSLKFLRWKIPVETFGESRLCDRLLDDQIDELEES